MLAEIVGPSGRVHYRRPLGDPMIEEAKSRPGYSVRIVERATWETPSREDIEIKFSQGMPNGYHVVWLSGMEMYYVCRERDDHWDGPYCDRFMARRVAVADSKKR